MTHIRSALAASLLTLGGALVASAQQPAPVAPPQVAHAGLHAGGRALAARKHREQLFKGIKLSAAEKAGIKSVRAKYAPQLKALRAQGKSDATRQQAQQIMTSERAEIRNALSAENLAKFDANVAKLQARRAKRQGAAVNR